MTLYDECIEALGSEVSVLSKKDTEKIFDLLQEEYIFTFYGRIDWERVRFKKKILNIKQLDELKSKSYILWDNAMYPALHASIEAIQENLEIIKKVSFDTWIYCPYSYVIEFYHEGEITLGKPKGVNLNEQ